METKITPPGAKALVIGLVMVALSLGFYLAGIKTDSSLHYIIYAVLLIGIIMAVKSYGKQVGYNATFGNYFAHGFKVSAIVTIIMVVYLVLFLMIFPEFKEKTIDEAEKRMRADGSTTDEQISQGISMMRKMFMAFAIGGTIFMNLAIGAIGGLIGAAMTKKDKHNIQHDINKIGS